jgi:hypothetical protein
MAGVDVVSIGDIDSEGTIDLAVGAPGDGDGGCSDSAHVLISSLAGGKPSRLIVPTGSRSLIANSRFGDALAISFAARDSKRGNLFVGDRGRSVVECISLDTLTSRWTTRGAGAPTELGDALLAVADVDGDGFGDVVASSTHECVELLSGATGESMWHVDARWRHSELHGFGDTLALVGDRDLDGLDDVAVGAQDTWDDDSEALRILSVRDGRTLFEFGACEQTMVAGWPGTKCAEQPQLVIAYPLERKLEWYGRDFAHPMVRLDLTVH